MKPDDFLNLINNPQFISGIHNYCDRWCERCDFRQRCSVGATELMIKYGNDENEDVSEEEYTKMLDLTADLITRSNENEEKPAKHTEFEVNEGQQEEDFDPIVFMNEILADDSEMEEIKEQLKQTDESTDQHVIIKLMRQYFINLFNWQNKMKVIFPNREGSNFLDITFIDNENKFTEDEKRELIDAFDNVGWYSSLCEVKLFRAISGMIEDKDDYQPYDHQTDFNGSAKVAIIGLKKSIAALKTVLQFFIDEVEFIYPAIKLLNKIVKEVEKQFPNVYEFKRPGFDD